MLHINFAWVISKCKSYGWKWNLLVFQKVKGIICIKISSEHAQNNLCTQYVFGACSELAIFMNWTFNSMNNLLSFCGLVDARISASEKDLPVKVSKFQNEFIKSSFLPKYEAKNCKDFCLVVLHSTGQKSLQYLVHILGMMTS